MQLLCYECEALVGNNLGIALLLQPFIDAQLVAFRELELLVNQAVILEELVQTTLSDVQD